MDINEEITIEIHKKLQRMNALVEIYDYKAVLELCQEVLLEAEKISYIKGKIEAYKMLGMVYFNKGDYPKTLEYAIKVSKLLEDMDGLEEVDAVLDNYLAFANFFIRHKDYEDALKLLKNGLNLAIKKNNHIQEVTISNTMGNVFCELQQYDVAQEVLENALDIAIKNAYIKLVPEIKLNLTKLCIAVGAYDEAKQCLDESVNEMKDLNNFQSLIHGELLYAHIAFIGQDFEGARRYAQKAESTAEAYGFHAEMADAYEWLHLACCAQKNFEAAYDYLLKYVDISGKMVNVEKEKLISRMRVKYDLYQKEKETEILKDKNQKIRKQREELEYLMEVLGRQNEELHSTAIKDYLTGAYNRKYFMMKFEEEFSIADEHGRDLSCLVFDVDKFKGINDTYGHLVGDEVIKHIVNESSYAMGDQGLIGRFGGDEFVLVLQGSNLEQAVTIGENILKGIRNSYVLYEDVKIYATISIGVSDNKMGHSCNAEDMIRLADRALYTAKENGRNQLSVACVKEK